MIGSPKIVKFDVLEEQVIRGPDGFCIECAPGEAGEIIGRVAPDDPKLNPLRMGVFDGYYGQKEATDKKILRDAFAKGDAWLRMGDLMKMDSEGYLCELFGGRGLPGIWGRFWADEWDRFRRQSW